MLWFIPLINVVESIKIHLTCVHFFLVYDFSLYRDPYEDTYEKVTRNKEILSNIKFLIKTNKLMLQTETRFVVKKHSITGCHIDGKSPAQDSRLQL